MVIFLNVLHTLDAASRRTLRMPTFLASPLMINPSTAATLRPKPPMAAARRRARRWVW
jgi:hypothetical protein